MSHAENVTIQMMTSHRDVIDRVSRKDFFLFHTRLLADMSSTLLQFNVALLRLDLLSIATVTAERSRSLTGQVLDEIVHFSATLFKTRIPFNLNQLASHTEVAIKMHPDMYLIKSTSNYYSKATRNS